ncbi:MAG: hypothetical protein K2R98_03015 [Gemmataceae bacterium]|nr:hypothetical protein [Gemmataceae bacterium]
MAATADILREVHRLRNHAKDLKDQIERLPRMLKVQQAKVTHQENVIRQAQDSLKKLKVTVSDKEKELKAKHQDSAKFEKQRNEATVKKEYDALGSELQAAKARCAELEDEILAGMTDVDERTAQLPALEKALKQAQSEVANFDQISKARQAELNTMLAAVAVELKAVEEQVPIEVRSLYEREVASRGEDALSLVQDRNCTACYTGITAQQYNELFQGMFVMCKNCGRILYLPQQTAVAP